MTRRRSLGGSARTTLVALALVLALGSATAACGSGDGTVAPPTTTAVPRVVATTTMLGDAVRSVSGDRADVTVLMAPGDDPRTFTLPADQAGALEGADLVVTTGLGFEAGLQPALDRARAAGTPVLDAAELVSPVLDATGQPDPHVWLDPDRLGTIATDVARRLQAVAGDDPTRWNEDLAAFQAELAAADEDVQAAFAPIPDASRRLLTDSTDLTYLAERYGFVVVPASAATADVVTVGVDSLGPPGSATATNAQLLRQTGSCLARRMQGDLSDPTCR